MTAPRDPQIKSLLETLDHSTARFEKLFSTVPAEGLTWKPQPDSWSIADCVEHLNITFRSYEDRLSKALDKAPESENPHTFSWLGKMFYRAVQPGGRKLKAPSGFQPGGQAEVDADQVAQRFRAGQERLESLLNKADGRDPNRPKFGSPITGLIRFSPGDALNILVAHEVRHLDQAEAVTRAPGFPG